MPSAEAMALAGSAIRTMPDAITAGGDFHPALRTCTDRTLTQARPGAPQAWATPISEVNAPHLSMISSPGTVTSDGPRRRAPGTDSLGQPLGNLAVGGLVLLDAVGADTGVQGDSHDGSILSA
jgi:hypothetical protein